MRRLILLSALIVNAGCTSLQPIAGSPAELQQRISVLKPGDRVLIVTTDKKSHRFAVTGIGEGLIQGQGDTVPVDQVVSLEKREYSPGKTWGLVGGLAAATVLGVFIYAATHLAVGFSGG
jgi:hypothetical protein